MPAVFGGQLRLQQLVLASLVTWGMTYRAGLLHGMAIRPTPATNANGINMKSIEQSVPTPHEQQDQRSDTLDWDALMADPTPAYPPRPVLPSSLPDHAATLRISRNSMLPSEEYVEIRRMIYLLSWFGKWVKMDPPLMDMNYVWRPEEMCENFAFSVDKETFCSVLGNRPLMLVGDSITRQHYEYLKSTFGSNRTLPLLPKVALSWDPQQNPDIASHMEGLPFRDAICDNSEIRYMRADRLLMDGDPSRLLQPHSIDMRWTESLKNFEGIVIMNRGAHPEPDDKLVSDLRVSFGYVRGAAPDSLFFWRTTPPGHQNCSEIKEPLKELQQAEDLPHKWGTFWNQSKLIVDMINDEFPFIIPLDVSLATGLKGDGHADCLHYKNNEPYAFWTSLLINTLNLLDSRSQKRGSKD